MTPFLGHNVTFGCWNIVQVLSLARCLLTGGEVGHRSTDHVTGRLVARYILVYLGTLRGVGRQGGQGTQYVRWDGLEGDARSVVPCLFCHVYEKSTIVCGDLKALESKSVPTKHWDTLKA